MGINVAMIGAGYWGKNICRNLQNCDMVELVTICDTSLDRALNLKNNFAPTAKVCTDFNDILLDKSIDAVSIVTPVQTHFNFAKQALLNGKHVLVEKPMALSSKEAAALVECAKQTNLRFMCDHTFCYCGPVRAIKKIIQSGELGQLLKINSTRLNLGLLQKDVNVLWDLSPHDISIINYITSGDEHPISVLAHGKSIAGYNHEVDAMMSIEFKSGLLATVHNSWLYPTKERKMTIVGTKKMLLWDDLSEDKLILFDRGVNVINHKNFEYYDEKKDVVDFVATEPLSLMVEEFANAIIEERTALSGPDEGFETIKLLEAADQSLRNNKRIQL